MKTKINHTFTHNIYITRIKQFHKKRVAIKSSDFLSALVRGQASKPYNKIGQHFLATSSSVTSADALRPTLQKIAFKAL